MPRRHTVSKIKFKIKIQNLSSNFADSTPSLLSSTAAATAYRGIHAGVTKSGVKKGENGLTRVSAAD